MTDERIHLPIDTLPLVSLCDDLWTEEGFVHPDRVMDVNVLLYVRKGEFEIYEEGERYLVPEGSVLFLKQGLHHWGRKHCPRGTRWFFVHFHLPGEERAEHVASQAEDFAYVEGSEQTASHYIALPKLMELPTKGMIVSRFESLLGMYRSSDPQERAYMNAYLYRLLLDIHYEAEAARPVASHALRIRQIKHLLEALSQTPFSAQVIEERMGLSYKHLSAVFKEATGMTMQAYHTQLRMEQAARLLRQGDISIREVSERLGFTEPFYFTTVFKKQMGCSPSEYRKGAVRI